MFGHLQKVFEYFGLTRLNMKLVYSKWLMQYPGQLCNLKGAKLALKYEAAGKIRVFAIVDYWTQMASSGVHKCLFKILEKCFKENDGTFDQEGIVQKMADRGYKNAYSYDLKSATDLIPLQLYQAVLEHLFGEVALAWLQLLVDRDYHTPSKVAKEGGPETVRYSRGQPMGALGSWASLAVVHHAVVAFAAYRAGAGLDFSGYAVLGDDIVIFSKRVAKEYLAVCALFDIPIGLAKSYVSQQQSD